MFSKLFDSISYPLDAFVFFIFVSIMYLINKKYNSYSNKTYRILLVLTLTTSLTLFFDFFGTDGVPGFKGLETIFARGYILSTMLWAATYSYYLIISFMIKEVTKSKLRTLKIIVYSFNIVLFIVSCFLELEYHHRTIYAIGGKALIPLYVEFAVTGTIYLLCPILKYKQMNRTQLIMHSMILIILIIMTVFRFFTEWDVNYFTYIICIIPIALYFSSESSSYLLGKELEESKKDFEKLNVEENTKINNLSTTLNDHLSTVLYHQRILNDPNISETDFNNEKIHIYNETKNIYEVFKSIEKKQILDNEKEVRK
jgi:hypothetical protein